MKRIITLILSIFFLLVYSPTAFADEISDLPYELEETLEGSLDSDVSDELSKRKISLSDPASLNNISVEEIFAYIAEAFSENILSPLSLLGKIVGILLICSLVSSVGDSSDEMSKLIGTVASLAVIGVTYSYLNEALLSVTTMLSDVSQFMLSYVPVYVGVITSSGGAVSASGYYVALLSLCEVIAVIGKAVLPTICGCMVAISIAESISPISGMDVASSIKKTLNRFFGLFATIFVGVLSVKSLVGASADSIAVRGAKYAASSFVPVVGSAVSEAYTTVVGSLSLIRSATGAFGMIAVLFIVLRPIISVVALSLVLWLSKATAELLAVKSASRFLGGVSDIVSVMLTASILLSMLFVISTAVLMMTCLNV